METKKEIRKRILARREALLQEDWQADTDAITARAVAHPCFLGAELLFCYLDCRREAGTRDIIREAWRLGKTVAVPKVEQEGGMQFFKITDFSKLEPGAYGISEPAGDHEDLIIPEESRSSLVILPGVAYDLAGGRIGYGGGYYDRFLNATPFLKKMALGFELQIVPQIPSEAGDCRWDFLITEKRSISYGE